MIVDANKFLYKRELARTFILKQTILIHYAVYTEQYTHVYSDFQTTSQSGVVAGAFPSHPHAHRLANPDLKGRGERASDVGDRRSRSRDRFPQEERGPSCGRR